MVDDVITTGSLVLRAPEAAGDGCVGVHTMLFGGATRTGPGWRRLPRSIPYSRRTTYCMI